MPSLGLSLGLPFMSGAGGGAPAAGFDPATLPWTSGRYRRWWNANEATFMNGGSPAGVGDPVSRVLSQASSDTFDDYYFSGTSPILRDDGPAGHKYLELASSSYMSTALPAPIYPKDTGVTFFGRYFPGYGSDLGALSFLSCQDDSAFEGGLRLSSSGFGNLVMRVAGNSTSTCDSPNLWDYIIGGGQTFGFILVPDSGGTCTVKFYTDSATPIGTGTVTWTGQQTRVREYREQPIAASFWGAQDFSSNVADILNFLNNGSA